MSGEDGILGNLPRERPGTRSGKRVGAKAAPARKAAPKPRTTSPKQAGQKPVAASRARPAPPVGTDPVGEAARVAGQVAGVGLRIAARVAGGVIGRLPRP